MECSSGHCQPFLWQGHVQFGVQQDAWVLFALSMGESCRSTARPFPGQGNLLSSLTAREVEVGSHLLLDNEVSRMLNPCDSSIPLQGLIFSGLPAPAMVTRLQKLAYMIWQSGHRGSFRKTGVSHKM